MHHKYLAIAVSVMCVAFGAAGPSQARVLKFVVEQRGPFVGGAEWGNAGPYEMLRGRAYFAVDPRDPRDAIIVDLDKAPRDSQGMVDFSTQFLILKPVDPGRGNHKMFYAVNNRGISLEGLLTATTAAQVAGTDAEYAMNEGYTIVNAGWEGDVIPTSTKLVASLPIAQEANGDPIIGPMRYEYSDRVSGSYTTNLEGTAGFLSYEAADINTAHASFTVSDSEYGPKTLIPPSRWAFGTCPTGQTSLVPDSVDLCYFGPASGDACGREYDAACGFHPAALPLSRGGAVQGCWRPHRRGEFRLRGRGSPPSLNRWPDADEV